MNKSCCFTGHRFISHEEVARLSEELDTEISRLIDEGYRSFYAGGAIGFDTLASLAVLKARDRDADLKLHLILPCKGQEHAWRPEQQRIYRLILESADSIRYVSEEYHPGAMLERNRELVNASDYCLCYLRSEIGGTAYTVRKAKEKGIAIRNLCPQNQIAFEGFE